MRVVYFILNKVYTHEGDKYFILSKVYTHEGGIIFHTEQGLYS